MFETEPKPNPLIEDVAVITHCGRHMIDGRAGEPRCSSIGKGWRGIALELFTASEVDFTGLFDNHEIVLHLSGCNRWRQRFEGEVAQTQMRRGNISLSPAGVPKAFQHQFKDSVSSKEIQAYLFGPFRLDVSERRLLRDGRHVTLTSKVFDILHLLADLNADGITILLTTHELNTVAAHLPWVVCVNGEIVAEGDPDDIFTSEVLGRTYGADLRVVRQDGLVLVADAAPHRLRDALRHRHGDVEHAHHEHETHEHGAAARHAASHGTDHHGTDHEHLP